MFKLGSHTQVQTATTTVKTDDTAKSTPQKTQQKAAPTAMPSSGLQIGSFAKARHKIASHLPGHKASEGTPRTASSEAFAKLGFDGAHGALTPPRSSLARASTTASAHSNASDPSLGVTKPPIKMLVDDKTGEEIGKKTSKEASKEAGKETSAKTTKTDDVVVPDVTPEQRDEQYRATASLNHKFESHLQGLGLEVVHNSGRSNNCAIYSLLDIAAPKLDQGQRHQAAREIRAAFDSKRPDEAGKMLLLDMGNGGHGRDLVSLVNKKYGVDMQVGVVQAGLDDDNPVTQIATLRADDAATKPPTHRGVVWDQHGHFESVRAAAPQTATPTKTAASTSTETKSAQTTSAQTASTEKKGTSGTSATTQHPASTKPGTHDASHTSTAAVKTSSTEKTASTPFAKLASIGKWRPGASTKPAAKAAESFQLAELDFKTDTRDWAKDTDKAVKDASKLKDPPDPKFVVPPRKRDIGQAYDRSKPGFTAIESVGIRPFGNLFNATAAGIHGEANAALLGTGAGVGGIHDAMLGAMNGHALAASVQKGKRYEKQLDSMLAKDIERFQKDPQLDTLILTKDKKGKFVYDMDKVAKLAASEKPEHKEAAAHAKNVFLTAYIKDEVAGKRRNRATYELTRNTVGFASAGAVLGGTLGIAAAPGAAAAIGAKSAGLSLGFANALDLAKGVRGLKQRMRDDKERDINDRFLTKRMDMKDVAYSSSMPQEAIDGAQAALKANAKSDADEVLFRSLLTGKHIDETKSTEAKKGRADIAAKHAYEVVDYHVNEFATEKEGNLEAFHRNLTEPGLSQRDKTKRLASSVKDDPSLRSAYDLMRDVGMRRSEANVAIHALIRRKIDTEMAGDPNRAGATTLAAQKYDGKPEAGDIRDMRAVLRRH